MAIKYDLIRLKLSLPYMTSCIYSLLTTVYQYTAAVHLLVTDSDEFLVMTLIAYIWFLMINNRCNTYIHTH